MCNKLVEQPLSVASEHGTVFLEGRAVAVGMAPEAAIETADRLIEEASAAMGERVMADAAGKPTTAIKYDPDIDQADGGVHDTPAPNPNTVHHDPRYVPGQQHGSDATDHDQLKV